MSEPMAAERRAEIRRQAEETLAQSERFQAAHGDSARRDPRLLDGLCADANAAADARVALELLAEVDRLRAENARLSEGWYKTRSFWECKVCGNVPDEDGTINHGRGCYTQSEDGGGTSHEPLSVGERE